MISWVIVACVTIAELCLCGCTSNGGVTSRPAYSDLDPGKVILGSPTIDGDSYKVKDLVAAVNGLRQIGRAEAEQALSRYAQSENADSGRLLLICMCLFRDRIRWDEVALGEPDPATNAATRSEFRQFPLGFSDGVPFLLIHGYRLGGLGTPPAAILAMCLDHPIVTTALPVRGYEKAAKDLVSSENFRKLYPNRFDQEEMAGVIERQAQSQP